MKKFISHSVLLLISAIAVGQTQPDTILPGKRVDAGQVLTEVNVLSPKFNVGTKTDTCSKLNHLVFSGRFLCDILASFGHAYLKQTAPGQLATISLNGGNASQTQVTWQGINLNNPATGQTDFSLVPVALFSNISVLNGSTGASGGSGSVSGSVLLKNNADANQNSWNILGGVHYGSFGRFSSNAGFALNKTKFSFTLHMFYVDLKNDYAYKDENDEEKTMQNAGVKAYGGLTTLTFRTKKGTISTSGWYQQNKRNIPALSSQLVSVAKQDDALTRIVLNYIPRRNIPFLNLTLAYLSDGISYYSGYNNDVSFSKLNTLTVESKAQFIIRHVTNLAKINASVFFGENNGYQNNEVMTRFGISYFLQEEVEFSEYLIYNWSLSFREELNQTEFSIPIIQGGVELKTKRKSKQLSSNYLSLKLNGGTVYRFPTMNDLFWYPGGNPDLKSERGGSANAGLAYHIAKKGKFAMTAEFNHFERYVYNMIVWQPRNGYWTPQNLMEVWSRGSESHIYLEFFDKVKLSIDASLNYTLSTPQKTAIENDASIGRQMLYVPMYTSRIETGVAYKNAKLSYVYSYFSYRYTSSDNYEYLTPFSTHDIRLAFFFGKTNQANFYVEGANLLNEQYQWVASRPAMPRNFNIGLQMKFGKPFKSKTKNTIEEILIN